MTPPAARQPCRPAQRSAEPDLVAPLPGPADQDPAGTRHPRLHRREGDRPRRRAHPGRRASSSTASQAHEAAIGPDHRLRPRGRQGHPRPRHPAQRDREADPYNTYAIEGLPPGPIANPGGPPWRRSQTRPAPRTSTSSPTAPAGHAFAETLEQHLRNVTRWRQSSAVAPRDAPVDRVEPRRPERPASGGPAEPRPSLRAAPPAAAAPPVSARRAGPPGGRPRGRAFDASEGTARDPLLNRNFDLNSQKNVPAVR
jgi:hypothetical protein